MNEVTTEYVICLWPAVPGEDAGESLVQVDVIYESFLINHCQGRIQTAPNRQWQQWWGERWRSSSLCPYCSLILLGFGSIIPIAASYCSQTVWSASSLYWSNDLMEVSFRLSVCLFPRCTRPTLAPSSPRHFLELLFLVLKAVSFFLCCAPSPVSLLVFSPCLPLSASVFLWHQCKASIIERCMGVCVSGREGLGTPPAPPAEEALTAEHWGLIVPPPPPPISTSLLTSLLLSHLLPRFLSLSLFGRCCSTQTGPISDAHYLPFTPFSHFIMSI